MNKKTYGYFNTTIRQAFSLAELLISLITISALTAAFIPVITKKLHSENSLNSGLNTVGPGFDGGSGEYQSHLFEFKPRQIGCEAFPNANKQIPCSVTVSSNTTAIGLIMSAGGGGGGGAGEPHAETHDFTDSTSGAGSGLTIIPEMSSVTIKNLVGGGGGGGGSYSEMGAFQASRTAWVSGNSSDNIYIHSGISDIVIWKVYGGNGNNGENCSALGSGIDNRWWVCRCWCNWWYIPSDGCSSSYDWDHWYGPVDTDTSSREWNDSCTGASDYDKTETKYEGCSVSSSRSCDKCNIQVLGVNDIGCDAYGGNGGIGAGYTGPYAITSTDLTGGHIWMSGPWLGEYPSTVGIYKSNGTSVYHVSAMPGVSGTSAVCESKFGYKTCNNGNYGSNNCTLNVNGTTSWSCYNSGSGVEVTYKELLDDHYNGGGGQAGATLKNITIPSEILKANIGGKIYVTKGAAVAGGAGSGTTNTSAGNAGNPSKVEVKDSSGTVKWSIKVSGGAGGNGATTSTAGTGGSGSCYLEVFDGTNTVTYLTREDAVAAGYTEFYCGNAGGAGNIAMGGSGVTSVGGGGGSSAHGSYGKGGTGGIEGGTGGTSAAGRIELSYHTIFRTPSGGGGGGGASYFSGGEVVAVSPLSTLSILVGGGGTGGSGAGTLSVPKTPTDGTDGADSSLEVNGFLISAKAGKGGKKGKTDMTNYNAIFGAGGKGGRATHLGVSGENGVKGHSTGVVTTYESIGGTAGLGGVHVGTSVVAPCGGFQIDSVCASSAHGASSDIYSSSTIEVDSNFRPIVESISLSAGGGGGGYDGHTSGDGGNGQPGFVYVWYKI